MAGVNVEFKRELQAFRAEMAKQIENTTSNVLADVLDILQSLSPHSPNVGVAAGKQRGRPAPYGRNHYRRLFEVKTDADGKLCIRNTAVKVTKKHPEGYSYVEQVETGWVHAPGYRVFSQAMNIIKDLYPDLVDNAAPVVSPAQLTRAKTRKSRRRRQRASR